MRSSIIKLCLATVLLAGAMAASAANPGLRLAGIALHQETGRDIYLGGIFVDPATADLTDPASTAGPRLMEYRVVARRTSMRSLLGSMLLQSEVASGQAPSSEVTRFANSVLSGVQGRLYAGDSLQILRNANNQTIAYLNDQEVAMATKGEVSDYLLQGWIGEQGPSTAFRNSITASNIDPDLLASFTASSYSQDRQQEVMAWSRSTQSPQANEPGVEIVAAATLANEASPEPSTAAADAAPESATLATTSAVAATPGVTSIDTPNPALEQAGEPAGQTEAAALLTAPDPAAAALSGTQVASLQPVSELLNTPLDDPADTLSAKDYSQRLAQFNSQLVRKVYGEIRYPSRAVRRGLEGRLELDVTLEADGTLKDIAVGQSSGHKMLDTAAIKAARKALEAAEPGDLDAVAIAEYGTLDNQLIVPVPIQFRLDE